MKKLIAIVVVVTALAAIAVPHLVRGDVDESIPVAVAETSAAARQVTADGNLKARNATPLTSPREAPGPLKIAWIAPDGSAVKAGDIVARFDPTDFENELTGGQEDRNTSDNRLTQHDSEARATRTNLERDAGLAGEELEAAKKGRVTDAEILSRFELITSALDEELASDRREYAEGVLQVREELARASRDLLSIEQRKADLKIRNAQQGLKALELTAPHDGILVLQRDWRGETPRVGATVWSGSPVAEIPQLSEMQAEVFVLEADAAGIAVDQKATVWLASDPATRYHAKVARVDKLARPRFRGVPVQYFGVTLALEKTDPVKMKPGSRVMARLIFEDTANTTSIPRQALFEKDGRKVVYVKQRGGGFRRTEVEVATTTPGRVLLKSGVKAGEELALRDPSEETKPDTAEGAAR